MPTFKEVIRRSSSTVYTARIDAPRAHVDCPSCGQHQGVDLNGDIRTTCPNCDAQFDMVWED